MRQDLIDNEKLKVAMIEFDFKRSDLLKLLIKRGEKIHNLRYQEKRQVEAVINSFIIRNRQKLTCPVGCFITFEYSDALNLAIKGSKEKGRY